MLTGESKLAIALDLEKRRLVDLEAVRLLGRCQNDGVSAIHCSQYIRDWVAQEEDQDKSLSIER